MNFIFDGAACYMLKGMCTVAGELHAGILI